MTTAVQEKGAAVVTGASRGIGAAIAKRLAGDGYGVVVNYAADADGAESVVSAITGAGGTAVAEQADVASETDVAAMFDRAAGQLGPVTVLVNNAGTVGEQARIDEQHADVVARLMQVNVVGPIICAKHAVRAMSTAHGGRGGSIVTIASIAAKSPAGASGVVPYETTKGALVTFARGLSNEVAAEGIRSNSVSPGVIETDLASPDIRDNLGKRAPLGRLGQPARSRRSCHGWYHQRRLSSPAPMSQCPAASDRPTAAYSHQSSDLSESGVDLEVDAADAAGIAGGCHVGPVTHA